MKLNQLYKGMIGRLWVVLAACLLPMAGLVGRLWLEQLGGGEKYRQAIARQSIRRLKVTPIRGRIHGSDGALLADNRLSYDVQFHVHELRRSGLRARTISHVLEQIDRAAVILRKPCDATSAAVDKHIRWYPALPFKAFTALTPEEATRLQEVMPGVPGMEIALHPRRIYPLGAAAAHLVGRVRRRYATDADREEFGPYFMPGLEGAGGLERILDSQLCGAVGAELLRVDCTGFYHETLPGGIPVRHGNEVHLTVDTRAQRIAQHLLGEKLGALVALDCRTGAVVAMASSPTYDPDAYGRNYPALRRDPRKPLVFRPVRAEFRPGSIVKPLVALCALENGLLTPDQLIDCPHYAMVGRRRIRCTGRHGSISVRKALETSCNTFFVTVAVGLGIDRLSPFYQAAGIGRDLGFEVHNRWSDGLLPARETAERIGRRWNVTETAYCGIGQGIFDISPLHAAVFAAALANGGNVLRPYVVQAITDPAGRYLQVTKRQVLSQLPVSPANLAVIREGMVQVVRGTQATAPAARSEAIALAGKTGTAQVRGGGRHTWFICFGPVAAPRYAVAVMVEDGVSGGSTCAPIATRFLELYMEALDGGDSVPSDQVSER